MQKIHVTLKGTSALLMHHYPLIQPEALEKKTPEEQAEFVAYRTPEGELYIPGINIQRALISAASYSKGKGRGSLQKNVAAGVRITPEYVLLGTKTYTVDARPVVIPSTKGRVIRYRPRIDDWQITFDLSFDEVLLKETEVRKITDDLGLRVGLLDFRPERKGQFGCSIVTGWERAK